MGTPTITLAKIVATAKDSSWAQAYTAGKLYVVLSLDGESEPSVASLGKETLEKLQREFFALDEKTLEHIKLAVQTVWSSLPENVTSSILLGTYVEDTLYLVVAGTGTVFLKRAGAISVIGKGEDKEVVGFSGKVESSDIIIFATNGFLQTISFDTLSGAVDTDSPTEAAESIAPLLHENALGTEAALLMKVAMAQEEAIAEELPDTIPQEVAPEPTPTHALKLPSVSGLSSYIPHNLPSFKRLGKKQFLIIGVAVLVLLLLGTIFQEKMKRDSSKEQAVVEEILDPNKQKYEDAIGIMSLNKELAIEELSDAKAAVEKGKEKLPAGSAGAKELDAFLAQINQALEGKVVSGNTQIKMFFDASKDKELTTISAITAKGGEIIAVGSSKGGILTQEGSVDSTFEGVGTVKGITADEKNIFVLSGTNVSQIAKSNGSTDTIIEKQAGPLSIDTFGGNVYVLSGTDKTIYKYRPTNFDKENYFTSDTTIPSPSSFTIDSSVYVVSGSGIKKFIRGAEDSFSYKGPVLSSGSQIYTDIDYLNLYVLDPTKKMAYVIDKSGNKVSEINLKGMKNTTSIAADEKAKKMYIVADNKIYEASF